MELASGGPSTPQDRGAGAARPPPPPQLSVLATLRWLEKIELVLDSYELDITSDSLPSIY